MLISYSTNRNQKSDYPQFSIKETKVFSPSARTFQYLDPFGDGVVLGVDVFRIQFVGFVVRCGDHHWRSVERLGECHVLQKTEPEQNQLRA